MQRLSRAITSKPMYRFLLILSVASAVGFQGWRTMINNFAVDEAGINGLQIGTIQSLREVPGLLVFTVIYIVMIFKEHRVASYTTILIGIGVAATGFIPNFGGILLTTILMSVGFHYYESCNQSLTLQYFGTKESPLVFGKIRSITALSNIAVGLFIWAIADFIPYRYSFLIIGIVVIIGGAYTLLSNPTNNTIVKQRKGLIFKRKYWLFYTLNLLSGARRQIFVVFAVFMLVEKYEYSLTAITALFVLNNIIAYFLNPFIGKWINRFGERAILSAEYIGLIVVFTSYIIFDNPWVAGFLYVIDHLFFPFSIGIKTWFQKTADPEDIGSSVAVGFAINHIAAVVLPIVGGALWMIDYRIPFIIGIGLCILSLYFSRKIDIKSNR